MRGAQSSRQGELSGGHTSGRVGDRQTDVLVQLGSQLMVGGGAIPRAGVVPAEVAGHLEGAGEVLHAVLSVEEAAKLLHAHPGRADDIFALLQKDALTPSVVEVLIEEPRLMSSLSLPALEMVLHFHQEEPARCVRTIAKELSDGLREMNAQHARGPQLEPVPTLEPEEEPVVEAPGLEVVPLPEPEPEPEALEVPVFDHTQLKIQGYLTNQLITGAVQVWLVFGVLQPEESVSSMLTGSLINQKELEKRCAPHFARLGINSRLRDAAWSLLTSTRIFERTKGRTPKVRFNRELNGGSKATPIVRALLDLNTKIDRP